MSRRVRRTPDVAQRLILDAAEKSLVEGGPAAVRVQVIARQLGISDAAIHHHFGSRQGLLEALLRRAGRGLRDAIGEILDNWDGDPSGLRRVADLIAATYADGGYARLALWLTINDWRGSSRGSGMFDPLVDAVHAARLQAARLHGAPRPRREDSAYGVTLLNMAFVAEPLVGEAFLRAVDIVPDNESRARFHRWLVRQLVAMLLPDPE